MSDTDVKDLCDDFLTKIEEVKEKLSDSEYKSIVDILHQHHKKQEKKSRKLLLANLMELQHHVFDIHQNRTSVTIPNLHSAILKAFNSICWSMSRPIWCDFTKEQKANSILNSLLRSYGTVECSGDIEDVDGDCDSHFAISFCALDSFTMSELRSVLDLIEKNLCD